MNYRFFDMNYRLLGYAGSPTPCYNVMSLRENQATAKQAFGFLGSLTSKYPAKQDGEHEVRICELIVEISKGFSIGKDWLYREGGLFYGKQNCTEHRFLSWEGGN